MCEREIEEMEDVLWISWRERKDRRKGAVEIIPECWWRRRWQVEISYP